ncbi:MAG: lysophospholipase [Bacteroidales bacterium]|nr:lysophospholipase [Bacteroidales bacterium]
MKDKYFTLPASADGIALAVAVYEPDNLADAVGIVQLVHGMVEHKARYYSLMEWLTTKGYICVIHDHRGHGESVNNGVELGYMGRGGWKALVADTKIVGDWARAEYGAGGAQDTGTGTGKSRLPYTLFGHSMGSMVVRSYAKRYDDTIDRLIVCGSPSNNPAKGFGRALAWILGTFGGWHRRPDLLQNISFKGYNDRFSPENQRFDKAWACSDEKVLEAVHNDPLCTFHFTANGFYNLYGLMADCYGGNRWLVSKPEMPIHFISGADDPCLHDEARFNSAVEFLRSRGYRNVSAKLYPGMRHQILNEKNKTVVWNDLLALLG